MTDEARSGVPRPFHEVRCSSPLERRLLLISHAFPPEPSVGSLRWQKMSRFAFERGWGLDVITVDPAGLPAADYHRLEDLPPGVRLYGVPAPILPLRRLEKVAAGLARRVRRNVRLGLPRSTRETAGHTARGARPDASMVRDEIRWTFRRPREFVRAYLAWSNYAHYGRWARDAADLALRLIDPAVHRAVITSAPPHMVHDAGRRVSRATGLPFVMDMRDPWRLVEVVSEEVASPLWLWLAAYHERRAIAQASLIVANTDTCRHAMAESYPEKGESIITVMNGCDEDPLPPSRHSDRFTIAYAGGLYWGRNPRPLIAAIARVVQELALTPQQIGLEIIGDVDSGRGPPLAEIARAEGVSDFVRFGRPRPRREALEFLASATMLVNFDVTENSLVIAAKVFEYMRFDAWLLALTRPGTAPDQLLRGTGADIVSPDDVEGITAVLRKRYELYRSGIRPTAIAGNGRFSRRSQATVLLDNVETLTSKPRDASPARDLYAARST